MLAQAVSDKIDGAVDYVNGKIDDGIDYANESVNNGIEMVNSKVDDKVEDIRNAFNNATNSVSMGLSGFFEDNALDVIRAASLTGNIVRAVNSEPVKNTFARWVRDLKNDTEGDKTVDFLSEQEIMPDAYKGREDAFEAIHEESFEEKAERRAQMALDIMKSEPEDESLDFSDFER